MTIFFFKYILQIYVYAFFFLHFSSFLIAFRGGVYKIKTSNGDRKKKYENLLTLRVR